MAPPAPMNRDIRDFMRRNLGATEGNSFSVDSLNQSNFLTDIMSESFEDIRNQISELTTVVKALAINVENSSRQLEVTSKSLETTQEQIKLMASQSSYYQTAEPHQDSYSMYRPYVSQPASPIVINQINPSSYSGDETTARSWINEYQSFMNINGYSDEQKIIRARAYLKGRGADWYDVTDLKGLSWTEFKKRFLEDFSGSDSYSLALQKLDDARQMRGERPNQYLIRLLKLCNDVDRSMNEREIIRRFTKGLNTTIFNSLLAAKPINLWNIEWLRQTLRDMRVAGQLDKDNKETARQKVLQPKNSSDWICYNCGNRGHMLKQCNIPLDNDKISMNKEKYKKTPSAIQLEELTVKQVEIEEEIEEEEDLELNMITCQKLPASSIKKPLITVVVNDKEVTGRLDSGSDLTVMSHIEATKLGLPKMQPWKYGKVKTAEGYADIIGAIPVLVSYQNQTRPIILAVQSGSSKQTLWGLDFLHTFGIIYDFGDMAETKEELAIRLVEFANPFSDNPHPLDKIILPNLPDCELEKVKQMLVKFEDVFSKNDQDIGRTSAVKHRIILNDDKPIQLQPYRVPFRKREILQTEIQNKLETGAFRKSTSQYASPAFLVDKDKGKAHRLVADYRALNAKTIRDRTPMPHPEDVFGLLAKVKIFAKLDITAMFNQIEVDERDIAKTAITTPFGLFECPLMPFGLVNAPATAVRLMRDILCGLDGKICFVYFDDIMVFAEELDQLIERCECILSRLRQHNLKLKPSKCSFALEKVHFLGHEVSKSGISIDPNRIEQIKNFAKPKNNSAVRRFHGLCSYNRKFIKDFASIAKPLTPLMSTTIEFYWNEETQKAFDKLKEALTSTPVLALYDPNAELELRTDASSFAIGAILYQRHQDPQFSGVITYYSKTLSPTEQKYSATERELLAAFRAVTELKHFLIGKPFILVTDHAALSLLTNHKDPHYRLSRWVAGLFSFDFKVVHKSGATHCDADAMSRIEAPDDSEDLKQAELIIQSLRIDENNNEIDSQETEIDIRSEQRNDALCSSLIDILERQDLTERERSTLAKGYTLQDGLLYRVHLDDIFLLVIPECRRQTVIQSCHDIPLAGHLGFSRTFNMIKNRYYWPNMRKEIKKYVKSCSKCQRRKARNMKREGYIQPLPIAAEPFDIVGVDLITKLPKSNAGYNAILVCTDNLSKFVVAEPIKDETADTFIHVFFRSVICKFGCPRTIITDQGQNFASKVTRTFLKSYGIKRNQTSAYHPQTNGQTERFNRTLAASLTMYVSKNQKNWSDYVAGIVFAYNITEHSVTKASPFEIIYRYKPRIPLDNLLDRDEYIDPMNPGDDLKYPYAIDKIKKYIIKSQEANKRRLDLKLSEPTYAEGDYVVMERPIRARGQINKLTYTYLGPFRVIKKIGDLTYLIEGKHENSGRTIRKIVHPGSLKKFEPRDEQPNDIAILPDFVPPETQEPIDKFPDLDPTDEEQTEDNPANHSKDDSYAEFEDCVDELVADLCKA